MEYGGNSFDEWRLPAILPVNGTSYNDTMSSDGSSDVGYNITNTASELSHLYYIGLENIKDNGLDNMGPFLSLWESYYWSGNEEYPGSTDARAFYFGLGWQGMEAKDYYCAAMAVHDERISAPVPEPSTIVLMGLGLVGLAGLGRKRFFKR